MGDLVFTDLENLYKGECNCFENLFALCLWLRLGHGGVTFQVQGMTPECGGVTFWIQGMTPCHFDIDYCFILLFTGRVS